MALATYDRHASSQTNSHCVALNHRINDVAHFNVVAKCATATDYAICDHYISRINKNEAKHL